MIDEIDSHRDGIRITMEGNMIDEKKGAMSTMCQYLQSAGPFLFYSIRTRKTMMNAEEKA